VIIGIGMSIAVPSFQGMLQRNRLATQANDLSMAINLARSEASRLGKVVSLQAAGAILGNEFGGGYCIVVGTPGNCANTVVRSFPALQGTATLAGVDDAPNGGNWDSPRTSIQFNGRGGLSGTSNQVRYLDLCLDGQLGRRIQLALIGRPKVWREAEAGDPVPSVQPEC
jgi:type IV fimbrial biogenesis protein FimT